MSDTMIKGSGKVETEGIEVSFSLNVDPECGCDSSFKIECIDTDGDKKTVSTLAKIDIKAAKPKSEKVAKKPGDAGAASK